LFGPPDSFLLYSQVLFLLFKKIKENPPFFSTPSLYFSLAVFFFLIFLPDAFDDASSLLFETLSLFGSRRRSKVNQACVPSPTFLTPDMRFMEFSFYSPFPHREVLEAHPETRELPFSPPGVLFSIFFSGFMGASPFSTPGADFKGFSHAPLSALLRFPLEGSLSLLVHWYF